MRRLSARIWWKKKQKLQKKKEQQEQLASREEELAELETEKSRLAKEKETYIEEKKLASEKLSIQKDELFSMMDDQLDTKEKLSRYDTMEEQLQIRNAEYNSRLIALQSDLREYNEKNTRLEEELKKTQQSYDEALEELEQARKKTGCSLQKRAVLIRLSDRRIRISCGPVPDMRHWPASRSAMRAIISPSNISWSRKKIIPALSAWWRTS